LTFDPPLIPARLIRRYKRFLADVRLEDGREITVHVANSGAMTTCLGENWPVMIHDSQNPKRKLLHTLEILHNGSTWIAVQTHRSNALAKEALLAGLVPEVGEILDLKAEVPYGDHSRVDWLARTAQGRLWIEVKHVSLRMDDGMAAFPDAVTTRGQKHLRELRARVHAGDRALLLLMVCRQDVQSFRPAHEVDPVWAAELRKSLSEGVALAVVQVDVSPTALVPIGRMDSCGLLVP
jgi:sugar fermentation stimulation protein A